jgi:hypothetical protein
VRPVSIAFAFAFAVATVASPGAETVQAPRAAAASRDLVSRAESASLIQKAAAIERHAALMHAPGPKVQAGPPSQKSTIVTEREVNSYLAFDAGSQIPVGITGPRITILDDRRLAASALVDLDAVRAHHKSTGWFDPMNYLSGQLPVSVSGRLQTADGVARFSLESATVSNIPIPKTLVQELVTYYSRTPQNPRGLNLDDPFPLPSRIRQIDVRRGEAVVLQ